MSSNKYLVRIDCRLCGPTYSTSGHYLESRMAVECKPSERSLSAAYEQVLGWIGVKSRPNRKESPMISEIPETILKVLDILEIHIIGELVDGKFTPTDDYHDKFIHLRKKPQKNMKNSLSPTRKIVF